MCAACADHDDDRRLIPHAKDNRDAAGDGGAAALSIGGLVPCSTVDWPGQLAAVLFLQGCPWRCGYCHNVALQAACEGRIAWDEVEALLLQRRGLLDGVVFSGGEPTAQPALPDAARRVRELGYAVALHTAGIYPRRLAQLLPLCDWVALDVKALPADYAALTGADNSADRVDECLDLLVTHGTPFECRTTVDWSLLPPADLVLLGERLAQRGVTDFSVQVARAAGQYQPQGNARGATEALTRLSALFPRFSLRD